MLTIVGLASAIALATMGFLGLIPTHRTPIEIQDPLDMDVPADFDAVRLDGRVDGEVYVATLTVRGAIQPSRYVVGVLVQDVGNPGDTYVYNMDYIFGEEDNYGVPTVREGDSLSFLFPLSLLGGDTYVVGLDAFIFGPETGEFKGDSVKEVTREDLRIAHILRLPLHPVILIAGAIGLVISTLVLGGIVGGRSG